ncbi:serine/threonine protein kinase [Prosthecobacter sp.]|uniref:serine/threonine protein kinase n=1 Tax=Prosthecobacter sp. TaxID=1965333 RepID=UPI003784CF66
MESNYSLPIGWHVGKYELTGVLSHQNFFTTYRAYDPRLKLEVAIKELAPLECTTRTADGRTIVLKEAAYAQWFDGMKERFLETGRVLCRFHHSSILSYRDVVEENGTACLVSRFVEGTTLEEWLCKNGAPGEGKLCIILHNLLTALHYGHQSGSLHNAITPQNILMEHPTGMPVLTGFANKTIFRPHKITLLTPNSEWYPTPYDPSEQSSNSEMPGPWSDLYALGGVLYRAVTGRNPTTAIERACEDIPLSLPVLSSHKGYSPAFIAMIEKAMQSRAEDRWQSAAEWLRALDRHTSTLAATPSRLRRAVSAMLGLGRSPNNATATSSR